jgi:hypothetical protein
MIKRLYDPKHIPKLIAYGKRWHDKTHYRDMPFSEKNCERLARSAMTINPFEAIWAAFDGNKVCGVLIGAICAYPYFDACYATDVVFIADKHGDRLFQAFRRWAKSHKADAIQIGVTSGLEAAGKYYESQGLQRLGGIYFERISG